MSESKPKNRDPHGLRYYVDGWAPSEQGWRIEELEEDSPEDGGVDFDQNVVKIPPANSISRRALRLHTAVHAAAGKQHPGSAMAQMLEEVRIDLLAHQNGIDTSERMDRVDWKKRQLPSNLPETAMAWLQTVGVACSVESISKSSPLPRTRVPRHLNRYFKAVDASLNSEQRNALEAAVRELAASPDPETRERLARQLNQIFGLPPKGESAEHTPAACASHIEMSGDELGDELIEGSGDDMGEEIDADGKSRSETGEGEGVDGEESDDDFDLDSYGDPSSNPLGKGTAKPRIRRVTGKDALAGMEIHHHIDRAHPSRAIRRPKGATDVGQVPELWERWAENKQVFQTRRPGGALLIDISGSMSWDWKALEQSISEFPAVTIAIYSGLDDPSGTGKLCVLAADGRWTPIGNETHDHGNGVDIEALEWLAQQRGPRVWLSDGGVIGGQVARLGPTEAKEHIQALCRTNKIVRADTVKAATHFLRIHGSRMVPGTHSPRSSGFCVG